MKKKNIVKIIIDIAMLILMILEYSKIYTGQLLHELFGVTLFVLFVLHNILNINFYKTLLKGNYNFIRILNTITNIAFLFCMLITIILGIPISQKVFAFFNLKGNMTMIKLHTIFGYWGLILLAIHLGLHLKTIFSRIKFKNTILKIIIFIMQVIIVILGIKFMIDTCLLEHLIGKYSFGNFNGNIYISLLENFVIILSISIIFYNIQKVILNSKRKK